MLPIKIVIHTKRRSYHVNSLTRLFLKVLEYSQSIRQTEEFNPIDSVDSELMASLGLVIEMS